MYTYTSKIIPSQVGAVASYVPVVEEPSPPHVSVSAPTNPNPVAHTNVQALLKLLPSVHVTESPFDGTAKVAQAIAEIKLK